MIARRARPVGAANATSFATGGPRCKPQTRQGSLEELRDELASLRSSIKTKLHLASLDARKEFAELEAKTGQLRREMKQQGRSTRQALIADATLLVRRMRDFVEHKLPKSEPPHG